MASGTPARSTALEILRQVRDDQPFDVALAAAVEGLDDDDRRLAHEISAGVLRWRDELDGRLEPLVSGDWDGTPPDLQDLLRIGAYQLLKLSRVPPYAAVAATVEVSKLVTGRKGAGLVNAVLRRLAQQDEGDADVAPPSLAKRYSHPGWLVDRWLARFGPERTEALLAHNNTRPKLVLRPARWSAQRLRNALTERDVAFEDAPFGAGLAVAPSRVWQLPGYGEGAFLVQDPAQARLLEFAAIPDGARVWDACGAPGGKAALLGLRGPVVAGELRRERLGRLRETVTRVAPGVTLMLADARQPPLADGGTEVALVDAPCTATGTIARHPDARWRLSIKRIERSAERQAAILDGAAPVVGAGGLLVYLTCSLEPEENEAQVDGFLARHPQYERNGDDLFIFPPDAGTDGGYAARLRRTR